MIWQALYAAMPPQTPTTMLRVAGFWLSTVSVKDSDDAGVIENSPVRSDELRALMRLVLPLGSSQ